MVKQVLNSELEITLRVSVTSAVRMVADVTETRNVIPSLVYFNFTKTKSIYNKENFHSIYYCKVGLEGGFHLSTRYRLILTKVSTSCGRIFLSR